MLYKKSKYPAELQLDVELGGNPPEYETHTAEKTNQTKTELCITLRVFYYVLIGLLLLMMIIICTIYISHLQTHVQQLDGNEITSRICWWSAEPLRKAAGLRL